MALSFIGKPISLISHSDVRYRGVLAGIDPVNSTIQLQNVHSMGTENRRPPEEFIPPAEQPYQYIIFRASEVKDLAVDPVDPPPRRNVHDDPAVLGASAPPPLANDVYTPYAVPQYPAPPIQQPAPQAARQQQAVPATLGTRPPPSVRAPGSTSATSQPAAAAGSASGEQRQPAQQGQPQPRGAGTSNGRRANAHANSVHTAAASLETVERALGDLRVANAAAAAANAQAGSGGPQTNGGRTGGRRGGAGRAQEREVKVPATDFDFASSNARFDKAALGLDRTQSDSGVASGEGEQAGTPDVEGSAGTGAESPRKEKEEAAYNPKKSFFDSLSSSASAAGAGQGHGHGQGQGGRGGAGRRGHGRTRREEEREKNVATFGEPGGVGLMGPGAYVGGWGGYGRRGARPRRGAGGAPAAAATAGAVGGR